MGYLSIYRTCVIDHQSDQQEICLQKYCKRKHEIKFQPEILLMLVMHSLM